ncbi:hypothetical protein V2J09_018070 [Rumex salicifolius]
MAVSFNLQDFIIRARVLKLYRQALRISNRAPVHARVALFLKLLSLLLGELLKCLMHRISATE